MLLMKVMFTCVREASIIKYNKTHFYITKLLEYILLLIIDTSVKVIKYEYRINYNARDQLLNGNDLTYFKVQYNMTPIIHCYMCRPPHAIKYYISLKCSSIVRETYHIMNMAINRSQLK